MNPAQTTKNLAQKIARQMAQEPLEVLKTARSQVTGETLKSKEVPTPNVSADTQGKIEAHQGELQDKAKNNRMMEAYLREIEDIRKQNVFKDLQRRIAEGENVPLEDYPEITLEQKQVLEAQAEAVKVRNAQSMAQEPLIEPTSKKSRRFGSTQKQEAEKQTTRVERPVPPSG